MKHITGMTETERAVIAAAAKLGTRARASLDQMTALADEAGMTYGKAVALWERPAVRAAAADVRRRARSRARREKRRADGARAVAPEGWPSAAEAVARDGVPGAVDGGGDAARAEWEEVCV